MKNLKKFIPLDNPMRLFYHKIRAVLANIIYQFPSKNMTIIWVTWTNWKTTTCNIIAKWLKSEWKKVFMFTTVNVIIWDKEFVNETKMTSPDPFLLQKYLKMAKEEWCEIAIIETASHWIKMHRVWGIDYDISILTNITQDHLDLHGTMDDYVKTKLIIFKKLIFYKRKPGVKKSAILNINSKYLEEFLEQTYDSLYTYWIYWEWTVSAKNINFQDEITTFEVQTAWNTIKIDTKLKWEFNVENILAAISAFMALWVEKSKIPQMIRQIDFIPWRMEKVENNIWVDIFVDYAHTSDALEKVLKNLKKYNYNKIVTVFWATGSRDKTKRAEMWRIVDRYSDEIILTQDDDYNEKTENIIKDILPWIKRNLWEKFWIIPTRREAIEAWIFSLKKWDCLLIAWKWDEHTMVTNFWPVKWHDKSVVLDILKKVEENKIISYKKN